MNDVENNMNEIVNKMKKRVILLDTGRILKDYKEGEYVHENY